MVLLFDSKRKKTARLSRKTKTIAVATLAVPPESSFGMMIFVGLGCCAIEMDKRKSSTLRGRDKRKFPYIENKHIIGAWDEGLHADCMPCLQPGSSNLLPPSGNFWGHCRLPSR